MSRRKPTHLDDAGKARMVDIGGKRETNRRAVASARVVVSDELLVMLKNNTLEKGDAIAAARLAGIQAAKRTGDLIPLCHPLPLSYVDVDLQLIDEPPSIVITTEARTHYRTGVEMEALTAAAVAALTIYDMGKSIDRMIAIEHVRLESKSGGASGEWSRRDSSPSETGLNPKPRIKREGRMTKPKQNKAQVHKISVAPTTGEKKQNVALAVITAGRGVEGDAHSTTDRPLSLLPLESFHKVQHPDLDVHPGDFAENVTTSGLDFTRLRVGSRLRLGASVEIEVVQIGKECHNGCVIRETVGDCIMPSEGVFARALTSGEIREGDPIEILESGDRVSETPTVG
ncbi:MAG: cyclic pyranopterin monophosphate synthase MoaC [Candidatus Latescibacterota bacterium]|nr:MAG: cyclic pyranopterin monophosphate synthase MoaC [Candidatus Latescibacterota bacterium]